MLEKIKARGFRGEKQSVIESGFKRVFHPGATIFNEGEPGDAAYIIESGEVEISILKRGEKQLIAVLQPGDVFGEMAIIDDGPRSATAKTTATTEALVIHRNYVHEKLDDTDPLLKFFLQTILERLRIHEYSSAFPNKLELKKAFSETFHLQESDQPANQHQEDVLNRLRFHQDLLNAFECNEFELHYQPIVSLNSGDIAGFEVLIRWAHPERGMVSPIEFIGATEDSGLIVPIGTWVFETACTMLQTFEKAKCRIRPDAPPLYMSINFSSRQFLDKDLLNRMSAFLQQCVVDASNITVEITESLLMSDPERAAILLEQLKELGIRIAVDDFGTGYSSLSYLHRFPIDTIKIDRSFVNSMLSNQKSLGIVKILTDLAHNLGMHVIAEGIEEQDQVHSLQSLKCHYGQGYLFSRPLTEMQTLDLITRGETAEGMLVT